MDTNAVAVVEAMADPSRREIVTLLCGQSASVSTIAATMPVSRPAVSQHLKVLKDAGLVISRAEGTQRIYSIQPDALEAVKRYFDDFWQQSLMTFRLATEAAHDGDHRQEPT